MKILVYFNNANLIWIFNGYFLIKKFKINDYLKDNLKDKYHIIKFKNEQLILYSNGIYYNIYIHVCVPVSDIKLIEASENCYADKPIQYKKLNRTIIGFMTHSLIIKYFNYYIM